ncbi:macro domain-containing protein [Vibrio sp. T187]|uniref:macro domain-containing protein n=1 Tax=Vibrio TaxID=662 RepID=UPI0010C9C373|nr:MULTISPECIES: macro domain-containing protein [Vibrio]MBW3696046.1 macro domain-containing protein [Vibrio sp. T187]
MSNIIIVQGDITTARVDAIVNAANPRMLGGGGVDGAIHRAAGPELKQSCLQVPEVNGERCPTGEARLTVAGALQASYVIHTVGPVYENVPEPKVLLESAYVNALALALKNQCGSIAFPAISCGVYGYPHLEAAEVALAVCKREEYLGLIIYFYLFDEAMAMLWREVDSQY